MNKVKGTKNINIVILGWYPPPFGGIASLNKQYSEIWAKQGHSVYIFDLCDHEQIYKNELNSAEIIVCKISSHPSQMFRFFIFHICGILEITCKYAKELFGLVVSSIRFLPYIGALSLLTSTYLFVRVLIFLRGRTVDIIHSHSEGSLTLAGKFLSMALNVPRVVSIYGGIYERLKDNRYGSFIRFLVDKAEIIAPSEHCARPLFTSFNIPREKVNVVYSGIDADKYNPSITPSEKLTKLLGINKNEKIVLFVGQIIPRKGPHLLIKAIPYVIEKVRNVRFLFVGPDVIGFRTICEKTARKLKVEKYVTFIGTVDNEMLPYLYSLADVFVFPSMTQLECMGMSMKEAMASGNPVVAFNIDGTPEAVINGVTGFLVKTGDINGLANMIVKLLNDEELARSIGKRARERALSLFDHKLTSKQVLDIYQKAIIHKKQF